MSVENGYADVDDVKASLSITTNAQDDIVDRVVGAASRRIDRITGRFFWKDETVTTRRYFAPASTVRPYAYGMPQYGMQAVSRDTIFTKDIASTEGLVVAVDTTGDGTFDSTIDASAYDLLPYNRIDPWPWTMIHAANRQWPVLFNGRPAVQVTAIHGWPEIPEEVAEAALLLAVRYFKRPDSPAGLIGFGDTVVRLGKVDPDVQSMLSPFRVTVWG